MKRTKCPWCQSNATSRSQHTCGSTLPKVIKEVIEQPTAHKMIPVKTHTIFSQICRVHHLTGSCLDCKTLVYQPVTRYIPSGWRQRSCLVQKVPEFWRPNDFWWFCFTSSFLVYQALFVFFFFCGWDLELGEQIILNRFPIQALRLGWYSQTRHLQWSLLATSQHWIYITSFGEKTVVGGSSNSDSRVQLSTM